VQKDLLHTWDGVDDLGLKFVGLTLKILVAGDVGAEQEGLGCHADSDVFVVVNPAVCLAEVHQRLKRIREIQEHDLGTTRNLPRQGRQGQEVFVSC